MCGIAGVVGSADVAVGAREVRQMVAALARRGPDDEGIVISGSAVLGHRRLAIFDLTSAGAQPMRSVDGSLAVVFNGAIYNFRNLRNRLMGAGFTFRSETDTEVLLYGYCAWGIDGLVSRLRGMFAFGLWDARLHKLYLVRDRLGVKPVVFAVRDGAFAFASTVAALKAAGYAGDMDELAVADFMRWGFVSENRCIYKGIVKVPAASIVEWSKGDIQRRQYWVAPSPTVCSRPPFERTVKQTEELLLDAVAVRLEADVPVGVLLSGGIDSSLICWAVAKLGADIAAYTVSTPGDPWDESAAARKTAARLKIRHSVVEMSQCDTLELLDEMVSAYAEPFACASALGMLRVSRAVVPSAKVLLTGDGGDDLFLGYPRHRHLWLAGKVAEGTPRFVSDVVCDWTRHLPRVGPLRRAVAFMDYVSGGLSAYLSQSATLARYQAKGLLGSRLRDLIVDVDSIVAAVSGTSTLAKFIEFERQTRFVGEYLAKVDGATMHYGLEARSPFLDHKLWEFASALPFDVRLYHGRLKAILREIVRKNIGIGVALRSKRGFGIPVQRWLADRWFARAEEALEQSILGQEGWVNVDQALAQLRQAAVGGTVPSELWYICVLDNWIAQQRSGAVDRKVGNKIGGASGLESVVNKATGVIA